MGVRLSIEGLEKVYRKGPETVTVLRGLSVEVPAGGQVVVTGVSGSGKSTFLHILGTLERPTAGSVRFDGVDPFHAGERALAHFRNRTIGFVFQFHHLLEEFSALENAAMPLLLRGAGRRQALERAAAMLEAVGVGHRSSHLPAELSGGEQQRVAIARALVGAPPLLLMDEPTGNLDVETAEGIHGLILEVVERVGATLVVVTHNPRFAERFPIRYELHEGVLHAR